MSTAAGQRGPRMKRSKSSLLAFKLREFLDTPDDSLLACPAADPVAPRVRRPSAASMCYPLAETEPVMYPAPTPGRGAVWVDCYFYGFYIDADKVEAFQDSLREQQERLRPSGFEQQLAPPVGA